MLDLDPMKLLQEIEAAEQERDRHLSMYEAQLAQYHGPAWREGTIVDNKLYPANHAFEYVSLINPRLVFDNPRTKVNSRRPEASGKIAEAHQHGMNRWVKDSDLADQLLLHALDFSFNFTAALIRRKPIKGMRDAEEQKLWPVIERIPQRRFIIDPTALHWEQARYVGHMWVMDKQDLIAEAARAKEQEGDDSWKVDGIMSLSPDAGMDRLREPNQSRTVPREEVLGYDLWIPERLVDEDLTPEDGFHGTLVTLAISNSENPGKRKAFLVREPRAFFGPKWGPYVMGGAYKVPDSPYTLGPVTATHAQAEELNLQVRGMYKSSREYKRLIIYDDTDPEMEGKLKAPDAFLIGVPGFRDGNIPAMTLELGGITDQQLRMVEVFMEQLERVSGLSSAARGEVEGRGTATEQAIADKSSDTKVAFLKREFRKFTQRCLFTVMWYNHHDGDIEFALGEEAAEELGMPDPIFVGGPDAEGYLPPFEDLELEIEIMSMDRTTEPLYQRRMLEMFQLISQMAPLVRQFPEYDWKIILDNLGDAFNWPELKDIVDLDMAAQMLGLQQAAPTRQDAVKPTIAPEPRTEETSRLGQSFGAVAAASQR